jgi:hypothetical protein
MTDKDEERFRDEERRYCEELQRRMLEWEIDPVNFFKLQKGMLGSTNIAPIPRQR